MLHEEWCKLESVERGTWGAFLNYAIAVGVRVCELEAVKYADGSVVDAQYLSRVYGGDVLTYAMPRDCHPSRPLGFGRLANICNRLKIAEPQGWPIDF